jgi:predicted peptidase
MQVQLSKLFMLAWLFLVTQGCKKADHQDQEIVETKPALLQAHAITVNPAVHGFYSALPLHYGQTNYSYPLLVWIHGNAEIGNGQTDLPNLLNGGIPKLLSEQRFPPNFYVNKKNYSFVVLAPQFTQIPNSQQIQSFLNYAKNTYRIDLSRIYLSGMSLGGTMVTDYAADHGAELAAIVPIAGVSVGVDVAQKCFDLAENGLPIWIFQNTNDELFSTEKTRLFVSLLNSFHPAVPPRYTEFLPFGDYGHDAWTKATNPDYKEEGMNIYEWMLQYHR